MKKSVLLLSLLLLLALTACGGNVEPEANDTGGDAIPTQALVAPTPTSPADDGNPVPPQELPPTPTMPNPVPPEELEATPTPITPGPNPVPPESVTATPPSTTAQHFDYLIDYPFDEDAGWQLRGARRTTHGWEGDVVNLGNSLSIGGVDYSPASHRALIWDWSANQGAGPGNLAVGPLYLVDLATGIQDELFAEDIVSARWAPDGETFAYLLATEATYELRLRTADGEDRLLAINIPREFSFAPDGSAIAFTRESRYELPGMPGLYVVDVESGEELLLNDVDRAGTGGAGSAWTARWSPDSASMLLSAYADGTDRVIWAARDGSWSHALTLAGIEEAAGAALDGDDICSNQDFILAGPTTLVTGAGPCPDEPLMGAFPEATHLVWLELDPESGALSPGGSVPIDGQYIRLLGYAPESDSVIMQILDDPADLIIEEVSLP